MLFFGDALRAELLTVGLNPSDQEYLDPDGRELDGDRRRFESLLSLGAPTRADLTDEQCDRAIGTMRNYFTPGHPVFRWFRPLARVIEAMGASFVGRTAAHLDLVQESSKPVWGELAPQDRLALLVADREFLLWQLRVLPATVIICNGATVLKAVMDLCDAKVVSSGSLSRIRWAVASSRSGAERFLAIAGWNYPLTRPTGLGAEGEVKLGHVLSAELDAHFGAGWRK